MHTDRRRLDPLQNRVASFSDGTATTTNHYSDPDDSPSWTATGSTTSRNIEGPDGNLAATTNGSGVVTLQLTNLHGDVVATAADDASATGVATYGEATEFGAPRSPSSAPATYGWLGAASRSSDALGGVTLMGVRLYVSASGRFLSPDPITGGNANAYSYPTDPIGAVDTTGMQRTYEAPSQRCSCNSFNDYWRPVGATWYTYSSWMRVVRGSGKWHDIVGILSSVGLWGFTHLNWLNWQVRYRHREERICESGHWIYQDFAYGLDYRWKGNFAYGWIFAETYTSSWQHWL